MMKELKIYLIQRNSNLLHIPLDYRYDYVEVFDGPRPTDPSLGRFCQPGQLITVTSTSNSLFVRFRSDHSRAQGGFHVRYRAGKSHNHCKMATIQVTCYMLSTHLNCHQD